LRPKIHFDIFFGKVGIKNVEHNLPFPKRWENGAYEWNLKPILEEFGEFGPT
jgi:hypothetical protein